MGCRATSFWVLSCCILFLSTVDAQGWWHGGGNDGSRPPWWDGDGDGDGDGDNGSGNGNSGGLSSQAGQFPFPGSETSSRRILIAHAVVACMVWAFLIPLGGILLRLNLKSPWILRLHAGMQILSYLLYIAAVGLGIYLIRALRYGEFTMWSDPHPRLGIAILALAFFQPILGATHHIMFKRRVANVKAGNPGPTPGRTAPGHIHLWLGRLLIVLGMINGGLGIRLASSTPLQTSSTTRSAAIGYGVGAGLMFIIYLIVVISFEIRKRKRDREFASQGARSVPMEDVPPTYVQSQESIQKDHSGATRYG